MVKKHEGGRRGNRIMFNGGDQKKAVLAELTLSDGRKLKGKLIIPVSSDLMRTLNGDANFVEFETPAGVRSVIARTAIIEVLPIETPKARRLDAEFADDSFDPHEILGLTNAASEKQVRTAYVKLTKRYHPDRYISMDLPKEISTYVEAMSRRINAAYAMVGAEREKDVA